MPSKVNSVKSGVMSGKVNSVNSRVMSGIPDSVDFGTRREGNEIRFYGKTPRGRPELSFAYNRGQEFDLDAMPKHKKAGLKTMIFDELFIRDDAPEDADKPDFMTQRPLEHIPDGVENIYIGSLIIYKRDVTSKCFKNLPLSVNRVFVSAIYTVEGDRIQGLREYTGYFNVCDASRAVFEKHIRLPYGATFEMGDFSQFTVKSKKGARLYYGRAYDWGIRIYGCKRATAIKLGKKCYRFKA